MNLREEARKHGGDEAVKKLDEGRALERQMIEQTEAMIEALRNTNEDKMLVAVAACEAMSEMMGKAVAMMAKDSDGKYNRADAMLLAVRSINGNVNKAFDTMEAEGVGDLIKLASKKTGALPDKED